MHRAVIFAGIVAAVAAVAGYIVYQQINRPPFALEVDAIKDTTDIGIQYRIRMTNVGTQQLTGIIVELGANDIQEKSFLNPGQSYYFYPDPETQVSKVRVKTNEGIMIESDYRSPTKVLGLPGAGR
ncbi:hypothetical protein Ngar_c13910 [Candidatus Nitrososphaera gargensis Ga9.2]|uniref:Uncharacterized protein n=2 Tax=Candidatus Nitrososphaera gargensis TaxID=497727 RepID=K0IHF0_NITGG|nr:hypothetical protein Ngar_c13910 [Candidatus Nitrososphaera gargensis Ga9.2]